MSASPTCAQATSGELAAGKLSQRQPPYRRPRPPVKQNFPGRRDRRPAETPAPRPTRSTDAATVGLLLLLLALGGHTLSPSRARAAWEIAGRWAAEYVTARHPEVRP